MPPRREQLASAAPGKISTIEAANDLASLPGWIEGGCVAIGPVPAHLDDATRRGVLWEAEPGRFLLRVPGVARYLASDGRALTIEPALGADVREINRFALSTPLAALSLQRGLPTLHAATVVGPAGAVVLCGDSAAGKSTLAAALTLRGWSLLADDLTPIAISEDGACLAQPTASHLTLWPDALKALRIDSPDRRIGPTRWSPDDLSVGAAPIVAVWILRAETAVELRAEEVRGADTFLAVSEAAYNSKITTALLAPRAHLESAGALARTARMRRVWRPSNGWHVETLAELVLADGPAA
jgi:hypothetical protein